MGGPIVLSGRGREVVCCFRYSAGVGGRLYVASGYEIISVAHLKNVRYFGHQRIVRVAESGVWSQTWTGVCSHHLHSLRFVTLKRVSNVRVRAILVLVGLCTGRISEQRANREQNLGPEGGGG